MDGCRRGAGGEWDWVDDQEGCKRHANTRREPRLEFTEGGALLCPGITDHSDQGREWTWWDEWPPQEANQGFAGDR